MIALLETVKRVCNMERIWFYFIYRENGQLCSGFKVLKFNKVQKQGYFTLVIKSNFVRYEFG